MTWTAPMTAVSGSVFTAAQYNTFIRDNLLETAPAKATTAGRFIVTDGVNSIAEREIGHGVQDAIDTVTSTSFASPPDGLGPDVTVTTGSQALVFMTFQGNNNTVPHGVKMSIADIGTLVSGDATGSTITSSTASATYRLTVLVHVLGLTPGPNTFQSVYRVTGGSGSIAQRRLLIIPL